MVATVDFYLARADESAQAAAKTDLANVRERCLRSEAAWRNMADRLIRIEKQKQQDAAEKAARASNATTNMPWPFEASTRRKRAID